VSFTPTAQQQAIISAYLRRENLVIEAYAGTGKTTTLLQLAQAKRTKVLYVAYNASAKRQAMAKFPQHATCTTSHGLAFRPMSKLAQRAVARTPRKTSLQNARILGINGPTRISKDVVLAPGQVASLVMQTIRRFCYSADDTITSRHVATDMRGMDSAAAAALRDIIPPIARRAWEGDLSRPDGELPYTHDCYLKQYALTRPRLHADVILLDEAQDTNPCVEGMILDQARYGTQLVLVGDQYQELYGWRGATNSMRKFAAQPDVTVLSLTQSFRFGPAIAGAGNDWLTLLKAREQLSGWDRLQSTVGEIDPAVRGSRAILCRTNAEALKQALAELGAGRKVGLAGGVTELKALTLAAADLKNGKPVEHPELMGFPTWGALQDYVEHDPAGEDLKRFVDLVDEHGPDGLLQILIKIVKEDEADVVVSTVHKAKGLEWDFVRIAPDFRKPKQDPSLEGALPEIPRELAMVAYVAVTRAQKRLDPAGLAWVADYFSGDAEDAEEPACVTAAEAVTVVPFDVTSAAEVAFMAELIGAAG